MSFPAISLSSTRISLLRHLRSPALWFVALAAPIAALFMIPPEGAAYSTLAINGKLPAPSPAVLGLTLGIITATILTPVAYVFLRAGPTRRQPWQVIEVTSHSSIARALGRWAGDTGALWLALAALTLAGFILSVARLGLENVNFAQTALALWLPAAPSLALIAAIRILLEARRLTRSWVGDLAFFIIWLALLIFAMASGAVFATTASFNPLMDPFGFVGPIFFGIEEPLRELVIGSDGSANELIAFDAMAGVSNPAYIGARLAWLGISALIAGFAGLVYAPHKLSSKMAKKAAKIAAANHDGTSKAQVKRTASHTSPARHAAIPALSLIGSELRLILSDRRWAIIMLAAAFAGWVLPYREIASGAIWLALLFPLTTASHRWQDKSLTSFLETTPSGKAMRAATSAIAGILLFSVAHIPAIAGALANGVTPPLSTMAMLSVIIPVTITALATASRSAVPGRLFLLIAWYVWLSAA